MSSAPNVSYLVYVILQDILLGIVTGVGTFVTVETIFDGNIGNNLLLLGSYLVSLVNMVDLILVQWYHHKDVNEKFL